jgi:hypothetical protein
VSIEALNWARKIQVGNASGKSLLRAIADYADEHGYCFPSFRRLSDDCEFSTDTVRRQIGELQKRGLLVFFENWIDEHGKRNRERRGRQTSYEIRLHLDRTQAALEPSDVPDEADSETETAGVGVGGSTMPGGPSHHATPGVAPVPPLELPINNHLKEIPPTPQAGGGVSVDQDRDSEPEHFAEFWAAYPDHEVMDRPKALEQYLGMTLAERIHARAAALLLKQQLDKLKRKPKNAHTWLQRKGWQEYPNAKLPEKPAERVFIPVAELAALDVAYRMVGVLPVPRVSDPQRGVGIWRTRPIEPDLAALAAFVAQPVEDWQQVPEGSHPFGAWAARLREWTGFAVKPMRVFVEKHDPAVHDLPTMHPKFRIRKSANVLRVPCTWPPKKDGTLYAQGEREVPPTVPELTNDDRDAFAREGTR